MNRTEKFEYTFTVPEVESLVKLFRKHEQSLDPRLEQVMSEMEKFLYNNMTIDEAEVFFS